LGAVDDDDGKEREQTLQGKVLQSKTTGSRR